VGLRVGLDAVAKKKKHHYPCRELNAGHPARSLVSILTELLWLPCTVIQQLTLRFFLKNVK